MRVPHLLVGLLAAGLLWPAGAAGAVFSDPEDSPYGAADVVGVTTRVSGGALTLETALIPRPPAGWGGCVPIVPGISTCLPADMSVAWLIDADGDRRTGSLADDGADTRVVAVPGAGVTLLELTRFDDASGRWVAGPTPELQILADRLVWRARLSDLGLLPGGRARLWVESLYRSFTGLGQQTAYLDRAPDSGHYALALPGRAVRPPAVCRTHATRANRLRARIARAAPPARARLRAQRARSLRVLRSPRCRQWTSATRPSPPAARPGCRTTTRLQLVLEGTGSRARYVLRPRVVLVCARPGSA